MGGVSRPEGQRPFFGSCSACAWVFGLFWLAFGSLGDGVGNAGLSCLSGHCALSNANWNILARQSGIYLHCTAAAENSSRRHLPSHFGSSRRDLKSAVRKIIAYTKDKFGLIIKPNWHIQSIDDAPVDIMGYANHSTGKTTIRTRIFLRARRIALRFLRRRRLNIQQAWRIASYKGYFIHSDSRKIIKKLRLTDLFAVAARTISRHDRRIHDDKNYVWQPT